MVLPGLQGFWELRGCIPYPGDLIDGPLKVADSATRIERQSVILHNLHPGTLTDKP